MNLQSVALFLASHCAVGMLGFGIGIYALPIITAPPAPDEAEIQSASATASYVAEFRRDLQDSDSLHWGEGTVSVGTDFITLKGQLAPGPDYMLYLSPEFVETEADFNRLKSTMVNVGDVKTFTNFVVAVAPGINPSDFNTVIVWCESFGEFITAAQYQ